MQHRRRLFLEQLESRRVFTLPATQTFAEGDTIVYNGPTVDSVSDTLSFDAFIDFAGDVDSYYFAPQFNGSYTFDVGDFGNTVDPEIAIYDSTTGARIGYNDDLSEFNDDARVVINLVADVRYIVAVADFSNTTAGNLSIIVAASFRTGSFLLTPDVFGDASAAVLLDVPTDIDYYSITAPSDATGGLTVAATGSTVNHRFALFNASGTLLQGPLVSLSYPSANPNQEYRIAVYAVNYASSGTLNVVVNFDEQGTVVTNTLDDGPGSLRQAILDSNAHPNGPGIIDTIRFDIPGVGPHNIALASALPFITEAVNIDGSTQPGTGATPTVAIDGTGLTGGIDGLRIQADGTFVRKLNIRKFPSDGIDVRASNVVIEGNTIGTDWLGQTKLGNAANGIFVVDGSGNRIESNVVSGNGLNGIVISGDAADHNVVTGNTVGARFGGNFALPNASNGIAIVHGDLNDINNNTISGNTLSGVAISGSANSNTLGGNKIGIRTSGTAALPNGGDGVTVLASGNQIGGNRVDLRNVISGNGKSGIAISGAAASNNVVEGNFIGTNRNGGVAVPNVGDGVLVSGAADNRIGSATDAAAGNLISGNGGSGVVFSLAGATGSLAVGNIIGLKSDELTELGNALNGVAINTNATNIQIGGNSAIASNVIAANGGNGVRIAAGSSNNRVSGNRIGVTTTGLARGNAAAGVLIQGNNNTIGGADISFENIIAGNTNGITLSGATATNNSIKFNAIGTATLRNIDNGIQVVSGASNNVIGPKNTIQRNDTGIRLNGGSAGNKITQNSTFQNINLGIDLYPSAGFTANDVGDADTGANGLQNFPLFFGNPVLVGNNLEVSFSVNSAPANSAYPLTIEFYVSDGSGEGSKFVGSTVYTAGNFASGVKTVNFAGAGVGLSPGSSKLVGLATAANGNSSEFSLQRAVVSGAARLAAPTLQFKSVADINRDGSVNSTDATLLINAINQKQDYSFDYDANGDSVVSPQDLLLIMRTIQVNKSNRQAIEAIDKLSSKDVWDRSLVELMTKGLPDVAKVLRNSKWVG